MGLAFAWERPHTPDIWFDVQTFHTWTDTHVLRVWLDFNANWCGLITEMVSFEQIRLELKVKNKEHAMLTLEQSYFKREHK